MKRKLFVLALCSILLISITGCGKKNNNGKDVGKADDNVSEEEIILGYRCTPKENSDYEIQFYYNNEDLYKVNVHVTNKSELYNEVENFIEKSTNYQGVNISKDSDNLYINVDTSASGVDFIKNELSGFDKLSSSGNWNDIKASLENFECTEIKQ